MKASMCTIAWKPNAVEDALPIIADAGYAGVELWGPHLDRFVTVAGSLTPLAEQLRRLGLEVPMISTYLDLINEPDEALPTLTRHLHYALRLGSPLVRLFTGGGDSRTATEEDWRTVIDGLGELCALAQPYGTNLAMETHEGHLHDSTPSTLRLLREVDSPCLVVNLDIYNLFERGEDPLWSLEQLYPWVRIVHLKNRRTEGSSLRPCGLGEGNMDYGPFIKALAARDYAGYASIEWFGLHPEQAAVSELAALRELAGPALAGRER